MSGAGIAWRWLFSHCLLAMAICVAAPVDGLAAADGLPLPSPGTYSLNKIQRAPFAIVREGANLPQPLSRFTTGAVTLMTFFYGHCTDPQGCPLAWRVFETVRAGIEMDAHLQGRARLVFFSFDPGHDTPEILREFARSYQSDKAVAPWRFITAWPEFTLAAILRSFGQEIGQEIGETADSATQQPPAINHLLKVFLIDRDGWIREIYTFAYLDPPVLLNDIRTLLQETNAAEKDPH